MYLTYAEMNLAYTVVYLPYAEVHRSYLFLLAGIPIVGHHQLIRGKYESNKN